MIVLTAFNHKCLLTGSLQTESQIKAYFKITLILDFFFVPPMQKQEVLTSAPLVAQHRRRDSAEL